MSEMLLNERLVAIQPSLVRRLGIAEAAIVQQLHYWLRRATNSHDGHIWVYKTYSEWADEIGLSSKAVRGALDKLRRAEVVVSIESPLDTRDRTLWWRIDYDVLDNGEGSPSAPEGRPTAVRGRPRAASGSSHARVPDVVHRAQTKMTAEREESSLSSNGNAVKFKGRSVPSPLLDRAVSVLGLYNDIFGRALKPFSATGEQAPHLTQILGKVIECPDMETADFDRVLRAVHANPPGFLDGKPVGLGDIFGPRAWTRALENSGRALAVVPLAQPVRHDRYSDKRQREIEREEAAQRVLALQQLREDQ